VQGLAHYLRSSDFGFYHPDGPIGSCLSTDRATPCPVLTSVPARPGGSGYFVRTSMHAVRDRSQRCDMPAAAEDKDCN